MGTRYLAGLAALALAAALLGACGGEEEGPSEQAQLAGAVVAEGSARMVIDAVSAGEVDPTVQVPGTSPFQVDINILGSTIGYQGYQYYLEWDPEILALDSHTDLKPGDLNLCATPNILHEKLAAGCLSSSATTTFGGPVATAVFHCIKAGTSALHLATSSDSPGSYSTVLTSRGLIIPTELTDASVTCLGS